MLSCSVPSVFSVVRFNPFGHKSFRLAPSQTVEREVAPSSPVSNRDFARQRSCHFSRHSRDATCRCVVAWFSKPRRAQLHLASCHTSARYTKNRGSSGGRTPAPAPASGSPFRLIGVCREQQSPTNSRAAFSLQCAQTSTSSTGLGQESPSGLRLRASASGRARFQRGNSQSVIWCDRRRVTRKLKAASRMTET